MNMLMQRKMWCRKKPVLPIEPIYIYLHIFTIYIYIHIHINYVYIMYVCILCVYVCACWAASVGAAGVKMALLYKTGKMSQPRYRMMSAGQLMGSTGMECGSQHASKHPLSILSILHMPSIFPELLDPRPWRKHDHTLDELHSYPPNRCLAVQILEFPCSVASLNWGIAWDTSGYHVAKMRFWPWLWQCQFVCSYWHGWSRRMLCHKGNDLQISSKLASSQELQNTYAFKAHRILTWHAHTHTHPFRSLLKLDFGKTILHNYIILCSFMKDMKVGTLR